MLWAGPLIRRVCRDPPGRLGSHALVQKCDALREVALMAVTCSRRRASTRSALHESLLLYLESDVRDDAFDGCLDCHVVIAVGFGQIAPSYQSWYFTLVYVHRNATRSAASPLPVAPCSLRRRTGVGLRDDHDCVTTRRSSRWQIKVTRWRAL